MADYDIFNGDADGICALLQLRLAEPRQSTLITGVKRDIDLLKQVPVKSGVWKNKQAMVGKIIRSRKRVFWLRATADCSYLDLLSKGMVSGELWTEISAFVTRLSGSRWPLLRVSDIT